MYTIWYDVPYEGRLEVEHSSLEEVKKWLNDNRFAYDFNLDNVSVGTVTFIDVYELMREE